MAPIGKSIAVFGGNGFLGRKICEVGVKSGYKVMSFSRSGRAPLEIKSLWVKEVEWLQADIFRPESYGERLAGVGTVVHSIGILFENQSYKKSMNTNFNFLNDIQNMANMLKKPNPMARDRFNTYEAIQKDSAVLLADTFVAKLTNSDQLDQAKPTFVYISADQKIPMIPEAYITTKREAEFELSYKDGLRSVFMRPGFMYDKDLEGTLLNRNIFKSAMKLGLLVKNTLVGDNLSYINDLVRPPISTETVALAIYDKIEDPSFKGIVTLDEMYKWQNL